MCLVCLYASRNITSAPSSPSTAVSRGAFDVIYCPWLLKPDGRVQTKGSLHPTKMHALAIAQRNKEVTRYIPVTWNETQTVVSFKYFMQHYITQNKHSTLHKPQLVRRDRNHRDNVPLKTDIRRVRMFSKQPRN